MATKKNEHPTPTAPSYQEGSVDSIGGGPSGTDDSDRSGEGTLPPDRGKRGRKVKSEPGRDAFVSTDVTDKTSIPGKDPRTRS